MDKSVTTKLANAKYLEAETVSEDSEISSLSNFTDAVSEVSPFLEGISKIKDLIQELEESFRESSNVGNNLILRCVLLRAENQNLVHKIDEKNNLFTMLYNKQWQFSVLSQDKSNLLYKNLAENAAKQIAYTSQSESNLHRLFVFKTSEEIDVLHKTIEDLQKNLRERDKKIEMLCQECLHLKTNKNKMENDLKSKILSLEKQLDLTYETLTELQDELEVVAGKSLSATKNTHEALFLQEKLRCSKLMYEKVRLHHEIKRLEDGIRRQGAAPKDEREGWEVIKCLDKSTSEPLMRHF